MPEVLHFDMERFDDEHGVYFVITGVEIALVTEGATMEEAVSNLREAASLYYDGDDLPELRVAINVTEAYA